ncbi:adenosylcobinamide-phosphate synthase CbiB [uncultured Methanoregula sp.]|uniref:adenosylcobinamide-phosphate synthase CbiB n=1 Tax=uncultured Methanoregula sp. TaxID=1005933 RepID=UPI002AAAEF73|nr:adenosylcobinamide-phosphate synthase CbiB [uncultured Methanoregula sp.]
MVPPGIVLTAFVLCAALLVDRLTGDPHSPYHPVALLGRFIGWWGNPSSYSQGWQRIAGILFWFLTILLFAVPFILFSALAPWYAYVVIAPFLLKSCFAWRSLEEHTLAVVSALKDGVETGREKVQVLVSRDTAALDREHILSAGYESMTENITDSIISPLSFFLVFGLFGAAVYRAANTMDAMLGYRDERERIGWCPARMDDIFNFIPARITVFLLLMYFAIKGRVGPAWRTMRRDGYRRPGFNGGIVMAAMAGGVGIRFEKPGVYTIGDGERTLDEGGPEIIRAARAVSLMFAIVACCALFLLGSLINSTGI